MEVQDSTILDAFSSGGKIQYRLPHFQREYAWERRNWDMFFDDVMALYDAEWDDPDKAPKHFLGTIVVQYEGKHGLTLNYYKLVDGQQRLVTASLLLCALRDFVGPGSSLYDEINGFLVNDGLAGDLYFKVVPSLMYGDRIAYSAIVRGNKNGGKSESQIAPAFERFVHRLTIEKQRRDLDVERVVNCIVSCMEIVHVDLNRGESPYKIFESLNAKGKPLTQADLVRNYIAMRLPTNSQEEVFARYWKPIEDRLHEKRSTGRRGPGELTAYIRHYLSMKTSKVPNMNRVYETFRSRIIERFKSDKEFIGEIGELHRNSRHYDRLLRPKNETDSAIRDSLTRLQKAESVTAFPLVMHLYELHNQKAIETADFVNALALVENFSIRVFLNGGSTTGLNRLFPSLIAELDPSDLMNSLKTAMASKRLYPSDNRIRQNLLTNALYDGNRRARLVFVLEVLNRHLSRLTDGHTVLNDMPTIEHIMPQNLNEEWRTHLGTSADSVHRDFLNTIGNLTLVTQGKNSEVSDRPFEEKRDKLLTHALLLNNRYFSRDIARWDAHAIQARTSWLTELIFEVWPAFTKPPVPKGIKGTSPLTMTIRGERFLVYSWRGLLMQMVNRLHDMQLLTNFEDAKYEFGGMIAKDKDNSPKFYKLSSAGWWIYVNHPAENVVHLCGRLAQFCGLRDDEWSFTYE